MPRRSALCAVALLVVALGGCSSRSTSKDLSGEQSAMPAGVPAVPLDVREFDVVSGEGGFRGVFLKLSRLPTGVTHRSESGPPRIILDVAGPTGSAAPAESFPAGDEVVTSVQIAREIGVVQVVLDLSGDDVPDYEVLPMADWVLVRIKPSNARKPWAHRAS